MKLEQRIKLINDFIKSSNRKFSKLELYHLKMSAYSIYGVNFY